MQQHNATLPERNPFIIANKKRLEKLWEVDKIYRAAFPTAESPAFFRLLPQQGGPCFPQALSILLVTVGVHLVPQLDLFRGSQRVEKLKLMTVRADETYVNALSIRPVFQPKLAYTFSQSSLKAEATLVPNTASGSKFMGI